MNDINLEQWTDALQARVVIDPRAKLSPSKKQQLINNGAAAKELRNSPALMLQINLYRLGLLSDIEDAQTDEQRIALCHRIAGIRDFVTSLEYQEELYTRLTIEPNKE